MEGFLGHGVVGLATEGGVATGVTAIDPLALLSEATEATGEGVDV